MSAQVLPANPSKNAIPAFKAGDTVRVHLRVVEGESERIQVFEGVVIKRRGTGASESFTVRKMSFGVGVERIFPIHSPRIDKIEVMRKGRVRRARLFYLRKISGRAARLDEEGGKENSPVPAKAKEPAAGNAKSSEKNIAAAAPLTT